MSMVKQQKSQLYERKAPVSNWPLVWRGIVQFNASLNFFSLVASSSFALFKFYFFFNPFLYRNNISLCNRISSSPSSLF